MLSGHFMRRQTASILLIIVFFLIVGVLLYRSHSGSSSRSVTLSGPTMGTEYHVTIHGNLPQDLTKLKAAIDACLQAISQSMSPWIDNSEISKVNKMPSHQWIPLSEEFHKVLQASLTLSKKTKGAFDVTVGPLVRLWGFGPGEGSEAPSDEQIQEARDRMGYQHLEISGRQLKKGRSNMDLDFSAIAKGFGVDEVADLFKEFGILNYSVEIGGDVAVNGVSPKGFPWVVGIEKPMENAGRGENFVTTVQLTHGALATSGSYRLFRQDGSVKRSHIIDPRSGRATYSKLVSVTVLAPTCMEADGVATALMVMGVEEGIRWVEEREGIEALFLVESVPEKFEVMMSSGFRTEAGNKRRGSSTPGNTGVKA